MLSLALVFSSCTEKEIKDVLELVSNETVTVSAKGGDCIIEVNSNSALSAVSSAEWVKTEVIDNSNVKAIVGAYEGNEVRTATVTVSNAGSAAPVTVRINQAAVNFDFTPSDYEFEAGEGQYSFPYTADAALKAEVEEGVEWLEVEVTETELVLKVEANEAIRTRAADVEWTIGAAKGTFTVSQKGAEATLESANFKDGNFDAVNAPVNGTNVVYEYTTNSELEVSSDQDWIETYTEEGKFYINVLANNDDVRKGTVSWAVKGSSTLNGEIEVSQKGIFVVVSLTAYNINSANTAANTLIYSLYSPSKNLKAAKFYCADANSLSGKTNDELEALAKAGSEVADNSITNANGYGVIALAKTGCAPAASYTLVVWAQNTEMDESLSICTTSTLTEETVSTIYTPEGISGLSKEEYYGKYYLYARTYDRSNQDYYSTRDGLGVVTLSDGGAEINETSGKEMQIINFDNIWNSLLASASTPFYSIKGDTMKHYWSNGFILWVDQPIGDFYEGGELSEENVEVLTGFEDGYVRQTTAFVMGGVINDEGYIAFVDSGIGTEEEYGFGKTTGNFLFAEDGWITKANDFLLVPVGSEVTPAKISAARAKVAQIKEILRKTPVNSFESSSERVIKAFQTVRQMEYSSVLMK